DSPSRPCRSGNCASRASSVAARALSRPPSGLHLRPVIAVASLKPTPRARRGHPRIVPGSGRVGPLPAEIVLEPDDVVELRRRDLDQLASIDRLEPVDTACRDPRALADAELLLTDDAVVVLEIQPQSALPDQDALVLDLVALQGEALSRLDHQQLADVPSRVGPDQFVSPGRVDAPACHVPRTSRSPASSIASRASAEVASV